MNGKKPLVGGERWWMISAADALDANLPGNDLTNCNHKFYLDAA